MSWNARWCLPLVCWALASLGCSSETTPGSPGGGGGEGGQAGAAGCFVSNGEVCSYLEGEDPACTDYKPAGFEYVKSCTDTGCCVQNGKACACVSQAKCAEWMSAGYTRVQKCGP